MQSETFMLVHQHVVDLEPPDVSPLIQTIFCISFTGIVMCLADFDHQVYLLGFCLHRDTELHAVVR